jgi:hypothetical protein
MRDGDDSATASGRGPRRLRAVAIPGAIRGAIIAAALIGLAACVPVTDAPPGTAGSAQPPIAAKPLPGPVALAPGMTGGAPAPAAVHPAAPPPAPIAAPAAAIPAAPAPAPVTPSPPPAPVQPAASAPTAVPAVAIPAAAPPGASCPQGSIGMWSPPDVTGTAVYICRRLHPPG